MGIWQVATSSLRRWQDPFVSLVFVHLRASPTSCKRVRWIPLRRLRHLRPSMPVPPRPTRRSLLLRAFTVTVIENGKDEKEPPPVPRRSGRDRKRKLPS